jgi:hypothetical protein
MAEHKSPQEGIYKEGHFPRTEVALLELHRLMAIFLASKAFAALRTLDPGEGQDPIYKLQECEEDEITRILLMLAITARVIDDREGRVYDLVGSSCGKLIRNTAAPREEELSLREACNKIIHAKKIRLDVEEDERGQPYLGPYIYVYGEQGGAEWKAAMDIIAFAKEYASIVSLF